MRIRISGMGIERTRTSGALGAEGSARLSPSPSPSPSLPPSLPPSIHPSLSPFATSLSPFPPHSWTLQVCPAPAPHGVSDHIVQVKVLTIMHAISYKDKHQQLHAPYRTSTIFRSLHTPLRPSVSPSPSNPPALARARSHPPPSFSALSPPPSLPPSPPPPPLPLASSLAPFFLSLSIPRPLFPPLPSPSSPAPPPPPGRRGAPSPAPTAACRRGGCPAAAPARPKHQHIWVCLEGGGGGE